MKTFRKYYFIVMFVSNSGGVKILFLYISIVNSLMRNVPKWSGTF